MGTAELSQKTTVNIQDKANLIWAIADKLVGTYKPHEYGNVILPMCVIKRFSDTLVGTKDKVIETNKSLDSKGIMVKDGFLRAASGYDFYNVSPFTFEGLLSDAENIADNFRSYLNHFSNNVIDVIEKFEFDKEITKLSNNGILYNVIAEFCSKKAYMGADEISAVDMGYIFEELVRKFSESYDEHAGAHFTARDIIYLMAEILVAPKKNDLQQEGITASMYDMAMGTSQMLDCLSEKLLLIDEDAQLTEFGQELNEQTYAIAKANMLIKGGDAENMKHGNTLSDDKFSGYIEDKVTSYYGRKHIHSYKGRNYYKIWLLDDGFVVLEKKTNLNGKGYLYIKIGYGGIGWIQEVQHGAYINTFDEKQDGAYIKKEANLSFQGIRLGASKEQILDELQNNSNIKGYHQIDSIKYSANTNFYIPQENSMRIYNRLLLNIL